MVGLFVRGSDHHLTLHRAVEHVGRTLNHLPINISPVLPKYRSRRVPRSSFPQRSRNRHHSSAFRTFRLLQGRRFWYVLSLSLLLVEMLCCSLCSPQNYPGVLIFADSLQIPSTPPKKNGAKPQNANTTTRWSNVPICKPLSTNSATTPPNPPKPNLASRNSRKCPS